MVDSCLNINAINNEPFANKSIFDKGYSPEEKVSIFEESQKDKNVEYLYETLRQTQDENGLVKDAWDDFKGLIGIGTSSEKCEKFIEKYKNGEISFEEAVQELEKYDSKQDSSLNLFSNIATSIAAIGAVAAVTVLTGGAALGVMATIGIGAAAGAVTKAGFKFADRATNKVKGDAANAKEIAKDAFSGAVTGSVAAVTAGTGANTYKNGYTALGHTFKGTAACAVKSGRTGLISGAVSGSSNYVIDCAFDDNKDFNMGEFIGTTAESTIVGGTVGVIMGSTNGALRSSGKLSAEDVSIAANSASTASYKITNDRIRNTAHALMK